ncbi:MAG: hypothetical protein ACSHWZ_12835 [Sulfitobacter sp.]
MSLLQAFQSALGGQEDKAGITKVDVYLAEAKHTMQHTKQQKISELLEVVEAQLDDEERKWFLLSETVAKWKLFDEAAAERIRNVIESQTDTMTPRTRYHALRAMGRASDGLLPSDILAEEALRASAPKLWLELYLAAYQDGNPDTITEQIISLVSGRTPSLTWKGLRAMLPEVRKAYGSVPQFRKQIKKIAGAIDSATARQGLLSAAEKRVGGGLDTVVKLSKERAHRRQFNIAPRAIQNDMRFSKQQVLTNGELAVMHG